MTNLPQGESGKSSWDIAQNVAKEAGRIIRSSFHGEREIHVKGRGNVATDVDFQAEREVLALLKQEFPTHNILTEETGAIKGSSPYTWILDPLDGSRNYASGVPHFCTSLALTREGVVLLGVTYDPIRDELFAAKKGEGAFLNGEPISVSPKLNLQASVVGLDMGYSDRRARQVLELLLGLWPGMQAVRVMGSAALGFAYAACGRYDIYFHRFLYPWDVASGILLVQEAGGIITDRNGGPISLDSQEAIASNRAIHDDFRRLTEGFNWEDDAD